MGVSNRQAFINHGLQFFQDYRFNDKYQSSVFLYKDHTIIIDWAFDVSSSDDAFDYSQYCEMQNHLMFEKPSVLRFNCWDIESTLEDIERALNILSEGELNDDGGSFDASHVDNTPLELAFESVFSDIYGPETLGCLYKEVPISNGSTGNFFIDYVVETKTTKYAFEENGVSYHHPCIIGKDRYAALLKKQNLMVMLGYRVYRFSTDNLAFKDKTGEDLKRFLSDKSEFLPKAVLSSSRGFALYEHQSDALRQLDFDRLSGKTASLIVSPMATGKSEICLSDLNKDYVKEQCKRVLILVPSIRVKQDWENRVAPLRGQYEIDVLFYNVAFMRKSGLPQDYYDYIVFDEAHHAQAANCKATLQYFTPKYLLGLTATDERLDRKRLEEVFGNYQVQMTLREAIDKDIVTDIRAFRLLSNVDLSEIRYNGQDFNYADLERNVVVESRNELIAETLAKYFIPQDGFYKQGIVFCVNKAHTKRIAALLNQKGLKAEAVYGGNSKNERAFQGYAERKVQFLCSCQIISEGWDSPQTEVIVMARPTLSKVLYMQQLGRGLRHFPGKECMFLIDVVDNYSAKLQPWNFHSLFHISSYIPFAGLRSTENPYIEIFGLSEEEVAMREIDIFTFEEKYAGYLSLEQAARELYIGTMTLQNWNKQKNYASLYLPIGSRQVPYFNQEDIDRIRQERGLSVHNDETIVKDFFDFVEENTLTFSFKLVFLINAIKLADQEGNINLSDISARYADFYRSRLAKGLPVDRPNCIYDETRLNNASFVKESLLSNPFEKFERKRFFFRAKDLNLISFNPALWHGLTDSDKVSIMEKEMVFLKEYYVNYGGYDEGYQF